MVCLESFHNANPLLPYPTPTGEPLEELPPLEGSLRGTIPKTHRTLIELSAQGATILLSRQDEYRHSSTLRQVNNIQKYIFEGTSPPL